MFEETLPADPTPGHRLPLKAFLQARRIIDPVFLNSPQYECEPLSDALGSKLTLNLEVANPIRSFKGRGADYLVKSIALSDKPIVAASAGNWGQALAYACRNQGQALIVFASVNANPLKVERMRAMGADVRLAGIDFDAAKIAAQRHAEDHGLRMVADGLDPEAAIGAGTIAMELVGSSLPYDAVLVPLGNGAMQTGVGRWFKAASPHTQVIAIQASGADAMEKSWRKGHLIVKDKVNTIADGIAVQVPIQEAVTDMAGTVEDIILVDDSDIISAMKLVFDRAGILLEPSGAAGVAALLAHRQRFAHSNIATILCGGNITREQFQSWVLS